MWTQKRDGKVRFIERYIDPISGVEKYVSCTLEKDTAKNQRKASAILQAKIEKKLKEITAPEAITLQQLVDRYAKHQETAVKDSTAMQNEYEGKACVRAIGADAIVDRLTAAYVMSRLLVAKETKTCTNARIKYLKACVRWGYRQDLISSAALADKLEYLPDDRRKVKLETKYMEPDELKAVLDAMQVDRWRLLTEFLCLSGLRIGELIALYDSDVDDKYIYIRKTYAITKSRIHDAPKTDASNRDVYIQPELADCIAKMRTEKRINEMATGKRSSLFYPDYDGGYLHYDAYKKYLKETTEHVLGRALTPHACRHTMTSIFAARGVELSAISRRLGHSNSEITKEIYLHITGEQKRRDEKQVNEIRILG